MRGRLRRLFGCYSTPHDAWTPDWDNPLPDSYYHSNYWNSTRQKALERQLTTASGAVTVVGRDSAALVNILCDRDLWEEPSSSRPQTPPSASTFRRLQSIPSRGTASEPIEWFCVCRVAAPINAAALLHQGGKPTTADLPHAVQQ